MHRDRGAYNLATRFLDQDPDRTALLGPTGPLTYGELTALTNRIGNVLLDVGVRPGDRVLLALADGVEFVAAWFAAQKIGAVTAETYTFLTVKDYAYYLNYTDATAVIADSITLDRLREAGARDRARLVVGPADLRDGEHDLDALAAAASSSLDSAPVGPDDVVLWKFTTGSTGAPKACPHTARSPLAGFDGYARGVLGLGPDDVVLPVPKLFFGYARDLAALYPFGVGGAGIVFPERTTPERVFALIAEHRPTVLVNVPTMMAAMVAHPLADDQDLSCLRLCTSAGEALPPELHRKWHNTFGVEVVDGIGSSELYHIYISNRPGSTRTGSIGSLVPGYTARVVDPDGQDVPDGEIGTLEVTGSTAALEYVGDAEKSATTFLGDGTVHTGDLVSRDPDGTFRYRGRADDLLKVSGIWVAPSEIEHCLIGHPDVVECAVLGRERDGLVRPYAFVVVSAPGIDPDDLRRYVRERLSPHKTPERVVFVDELPRTTNGKLDRRALRTLDAS
ncbi:benzoate-CoA ligase family protein [Actinokineospora auranticolor]|uniref:Benzoate-CoA ligase family protein n=1 Tax=Actinokineospora auranticolor TaxID=155976 RepID=A0A2S6GED6_9PSEU|nr:benzoate-CoA ligase family protein [Actinokineospora auranticolor]PPK63599.1 benzoate-CoA ligase family protein [Actinokineospora auranticolor]